MTPKHPHEGEWQRFLGTLPEQDRALAEQFPPDSKWQLRGVDGALDTKTYYTPIGSTGDGHLIMLRHLMDGRPVQKWDRVPPKDLVPLPEGHA